jgi:hypothetical protein
MAVILRVSKVISAKTAEIKFFILGSKPGE